MDVGLPTPSERKVESQPSLYQRSFSVIQDLYAFEDFENWLFPYGIENVDRVAIANNATVTDLNTQQPVDPVATLWKCFRLGAPLCQLFNYLQPRNRLDVPNIDPWDTEILHLGKYNNSCKASVYHFLIACRKVLGIPEEDLFTITELYRDDTSGFVKVLKTVVIILEKIKSANLMPLIDRQLPFPVPTSSELPTDNRTKLVSELLETERLYVGALEKLQAYKNEIMSQGVLKKDVAWEIFVNLDDLVDFQQRFLLALEAVLHLPVEEQRIGQVFITHEQGFEVYGVFCANYKRACKLVMEHMDELSKLSDMFEPKYEFSSYLIKPTQRICKYPLLLRELIKYSENEAYPHIDELKEALKSVANVTEIVNEMNRKEENKEVRQALIDGVDDWKGLNVQDFGDLQLADKFIMTAENGTEKDYQLYLFDRVLLCSKPTKKPRKDITTYVLKGNIYITSITGVLDCSQPESLQFLLKVFWKDGADLESFLLKGRNDEQIRLWKDKLDKMIEFHRMRRKSVSVANALRKSQIYVAMNGWSMDPTTEDEDSVSMSSDDLSDTHSFGSQVRPRSMGAYSDHNGNIIVTRPRGQSMSPPPPLHRSSISSVSSSSASHNTPNRLSRTLSTSTFQFVPTAAVAPISRPYSYHHPSSQQPLPPTTDHYANLPLPNPPGMMHPTRSDSFSYHRSAPVSPKSPKSPIFAAGSTAYPSMPRSPSRDSFIEQQQIFQEQQHELMEKLHQQQERQQLLQLPSKSVSASSSSATLNNADDEDGYDDILDNYASAYANDEDQSQEYEAPFPSSPLKSHSNPILRGTQATPNILPQMKNLKVSDENSICLANNVPQLRQQPPKMLKVRLHFGNSKYLILVPDRCSYQALLGKIDRKLRATGAIRSESGQDMYEWDLKFRDEQDNGMLQHVLGDEDTTYCLHHSQKNGMSTTVDIFCSLK